MKIISKENITTLTNGLKEKFYLKTEIDTKLSNKADSTHTHDITTEVTNALTKTEISSLKTTNKNIVGAINEIFQSIFFSTKTEVAFLSTLTKASFAENSNLSSLEIDSSTCSLALSFYSSFPLRTFCVNTTMNFQRGKYYMSIGGVTSSALAIGIKINEDPIQIFQNLATTDVTFDILNDSTPVTLYFYTSYNSTAMSNSSSGTFKNLRLYKD